MTTADQTQLHAEIEQRFPDNTTEEITPAVVRDFLHELVDASGEPTGNGASYSDDQAREVARQLLLDAVTTGLSITEDAQTGQVALTVGVYGRLYFDTPRGGSGTGNLAQSDFPIRPQEQGVYQWVRDSNVDRVDMSYAGGAFSGSLADFKIRSFSLLSGQEYTITLTPLDVNAYTFLDLERIA